LCPYPRVDEIAVAMIEWLRAGLQWYMASSCSLPSKRGGLERVEQQLGAVVVVAVTSDEVDGAAGNEVEKLSFAEA